jgi:hypothetical protein
MPDLAQFSIERVEQNRVEFGDETVREDRRYRRLAGPVVGSRIGLESVGGIVDVAGHDRANDVA